MWAGYTSGVYPLIESSGMLGGLMINGFISGPDSEYDN